MDNAVLVGPVSDLPGLGILDCLTHIHGHSAQPGVWHQASWPQHLAQLAHYPHGIRGGNHHIKIQLAGLNLGSQIIHTHLVGTSRLGFILLVTLGKDRNPGLLARAIGQDSGATHHLVRFPGVNSQVDADIN